MTEQELHHIKQDAPVYDQHTAVRVIRELVDEVERLQKIRGIVAEAHQDNLEKMQAENERLRQQVEFNKEYGIYSNAMKEIERLRKALNEIANIERTEPRNRALEVGYDLGRVLSIARKALEGTQDDRSNGIS